MRLLRTLLILLSFSFTLELAAQLPFGSGGRQKGGKIVFTKQPYTPGADDGVELNPVFRAGDAVYGTILLSDPIEDAITNWRMSGRGALLRLEMEDMFMQPFMPPFEAWEVNSNASGKVLVAPDVDRSQEFVQFVLLPNLETDLSDDIENANITPILYARGMSEQPAKQKKWKVEVMTRGNRKVGNNTYKGSFKLDLSAGEGPDYYAKVDKYFLSQLVGEGGLPSAYIEDPALENELLSVMNAKGYQEEFKKCYIQTGWQLVDQNLQTPYRQTQAAFTYEIPSQDQCGYQVYTFRSYPDGSGGYNRPQVWGGADRRERMDCGKLE
jgi:hypothetical protein